MSSLKDDGGWGLFLSLSEIELEKRENGQARKTLAERPKPRHPILIFQSVWALGPTGVGERGVSG